MLYEYCDEELVTPALFHGLSEPAKSSPARVRRMTGLAGDGAVLYDQVLGTNQQRPLLFINGYGIPAGGVADCIAAYRAGAVTR
ncbi:MAG: TIGR02391 family protein [Actinomycetota bacterium]